MKLVTEEDAKKEATTKEVNDRLAAINEEVSKLWLDKSSKLDAVNHAIRFVCSNPAHFRDLNGGTPDLEVQLDLAYASFLAFVDRKNREIESLDHQIKEKSAESRQLGEVFGVKAKHYPAMNNVGILL